jgi:hypothetical protein
MRTEVKTLVSVLVLEVELELSNNTCASIFTSAIWFNSYHTLRNESTQFNCVTNTSNFPRIIRFVR